jgi:hypothetical protein
MRAADATAVTMTESVVMRLEKAATLDDNPLCLHRRPEETVAMFEERGCDELRVRDEHNRRKSSRAGDRVSMQVRKGGQSIRFVNSVNVDTTHSKTSGLFS